MTGNPSSLAGGFANRTATVALLGCAGLAWWLTVRTAGDMPPGPGTMGLGLAGFLVVWTTMMTAMMFPAVSPVVSAYIRVIGATSTARTRVLRTTGLVAGYLLGWAAFGVVAFGAGLAGSALAEGSPDAARWVGAGLLAVAGIYQLTPLKDRCLRHCRSPISFLLHVSSYRGRSRDLRAGLHHAAYCVGCCWGLMLVLLVVGAMNLAAMVAIALAVIVEKTWRHGRAFARLTGVALIVFAAFVPAHPSLVPGLFSPMGM